MDFFFIRRLNMLIIYQYYEFYVILEHNLHTQTVVFPLKIRASNNAKNKLI